MPDGRVLLVTGSERVSQEAVMWLDWWARDRQECLIRNGVTFFTWVRRMTVDAYYTSPIGIADVGYQGNAVLSEFEVSREALNFVNSRIGQLDELGNSGDAPEEDEPEIDAR